MVQRQFQAPLPGSPASRGGSREQAVTLDAQNCAAFDVLSGKGRAWGWPAFIPLRLPPVSPEALASLAAARLVPLALLPGPPLAGRGRGAGSPWERQPRL